MASTVPSNPISTTTVVLAVAGTLSAGLLAYAVYFDHKRRSDPEFRKHLKRQHKEASRQQERATKAAQQGQKARIQSLVEEAIAEGVPQDPEEKEGYFMEEVGRGEKMCQDGSDPVDAALSFYKALKVYPSPRELMDIYDKTVPKPVFDILAEMIAIDSSISITRSDSGSATVE
ncbi:hypothetical protein AMS68_004211 [Peltaster fructicola]|uniref:Mitochondrial import receptor subunit TOM20 n=1 Tax=Peltaster fructicola TaxID=286661 RepID=A0A6H0XVD8_9PEZI|nr:hypothetical protein AMS68_004211 [Peltaster fructicola]